MEQSASRHLPRLRVCRYVSPVHSIRSFSAVQARAWLREAFCAWQVPYSAEQRAELELQAHAEPELSANSTFRGLQVYQAMQEPQPGLGWPAEWQEVCSSFRPLCAACMPFQAVCACRQIVLLALRGTVDPSRRRTSISCSAVVCMLQSYQTCSAQ